MFKRQQTVILPQCIVDGGSSSIHPPPLKWHGG